MSLWKCPCIRGSAAPGRRNDWTGQAPATTAMWPAVLPGGRPTLGGRRAATRRIDRCVMLKRQRRQIIGQAAGHRQVADYMRRRVDAVADTGAARMYVTVEY